MLSAIVTPEDLDQKPDHPRSSPSHLGVTAEGEYGDIDGEVHGPVLLQKMKRVC
jgi:hypothetical protein